MEINFSVLSAIQEMHSSEMLLQNLEAVFERRIFLAN